MHHLQQAVQLRLQELLAQRGHGLSQHGCKGGEKVHQGAQALVAEGQVLGRDAFQACRGHGPCPQHQLAGARVEYLREDTGMLSAHCVSSAACGLG